MSDPRTEPALTADERTMLGEFLDFYRATIELKVAGLTDEQARHVSGPGGTTPMGVVRHLAEVERGWFRLHFAGEQIGYQWSTDDDLDADFRVGPNDTLAVSLAAYAEECAVSRAITDAAPSLDQIAAHPTRSGRQPSLRWILVHMVEETARHAGHLDILREQIDGALGD
jgi:uncharacterized damage-inducible protein DinB